VDDGERKVVIAQQRLGGKTKIFFTIWFGQIVSIIGSGITSFGLGISIYEHTGSATQFALIIMSAGLPSLIVFPFAGAFVDRNDRRSVMIISDIGAGLCTLAILGLLLAGKLALWNVCLITAIASIFNALRSLAFTAIITMLVQKSQIGRTSGMVQIGPASAQIISPLLAGILLGAIQIEGLLLIDLITFVFALATLLSVDVPHPAASSHASTGKPSLLQDAAYGWTYIIARPGLLRLLIFFAVFNFSLSFSVVLRTPLLMSVASIEVVGLTASFASSGLLLGSILMSLWGGPQRRVYGILGFGLLVGIGLIITGLRPSVPLIAIANFAILFAAPVVNGCSQTIWQSKTAPDVQGRVFAVRMMIAWSTTPFAYIAAGPLVDRVFEPMLRADGPLALSIGEIIGTGQGRGIGLLFILVGLLASFVVIGGFLSPRLRLIEDEVPDAVA
jgi:MFS transporter, DHA3 family, macrolide efflux protein